jgi:AcrR family transcriptional regulator
MLEQGYAAVSTRSVAIKAGLKAPLVHYYFPATDDLFLAVYRRAAEQVAQRLDEAIASAQPLRAIWTFSKETGRPALAVEFMALANHRKLIRSEIAVHNARIRQRQVEVLSSLLAPGSVEAGICPPVGVAVVMVGIARALVMETALGISLGHAEVTAFVEWWLKRHEEGEDQGLKD